MGGKTLRFTGGSDCCLERLWRPTLTRLLAPKEIEPGRRSSILLLWTAWDIMASALAEPAYAAFWSDVATRRAFPK